MQEKIANLEIKIFYDSAITKKKKKKGRELSKPQCEQRVHRTLQMAQWARGVTAEKMPQEKCPSPAARGGEGCGAPDGSPVRVLLG